MRIPSTLNGVGRPRKFILFAAKLGEYSESAFGMQETDMEALRAAAALLVDETNALILALVESLVGVLDSESDVVHATLAAVFLDERRDGAFGACGFKKFDFHVSDFEERRFNFLVSDLLNGVAFEAHHLFPVLDSFFQIGNSYTNVFDV